MTGKESDYHYLGLTASGWVKHLLSFFDKYEITKSAYVLIFYKSMITLSTKILYPMVAIFYGSRMYVLPDLKSVYTSLKMLTTQVQIGTMGVLHVRLMRQTYPKKPPNRLLFFTVSKLGPRVFPLRRLTLTSDDKPLHSKLLYSVSHIIETL
ncbi:hypothetical protein YC2023_025235 [Brassica napus]